MFHKLRARDVQNEIAHVESSTKKHSRSTKAKKAIFEKIIGNITMGNNDMANCFDIAFNTYKCDDLELKRMCFYYFESYCFYKPLIFLDNKDLFITDLESSSPLLRSLTIKCVSYFTDAKFQQIITVPYLLKLLRDKDSFVRKTAIYSVGRLYDNNPKLVEDNDFLNILNDLLDDTSPLVVSSSLAILDYIVSNLETLELSIDSESINRLINLLAKSSEFPQSYMINAVLSFTPSTNEEATELVEKLLPYLQHENTSVVLNSIKAIIYLCNYIKSPQDAIPFLSKRLGNSLMALLLKPSEIQFLTLRNVILLLLAKPDLAKFDVTMFFCQYRDPIYVKDTKLEIIYLLANSYNLNIVLRELEEYATDVDVQMSRKSIRAIGNLAVKLYDGVDQCIDVLFNLASSNIDSIIQEVTIVMKNIYRRYPEKIDVEILNIFVSSIDCIEEDESWASFIWIIGNYSHLISDSLDILKKLKIQLKDNELDEVQYSLLTAVVKYYLRNPQLGEGLLLEVIKNCTENSSNPDLRDRAYFYWKLISSQNKYPGAAQDIILGELPVISANQDKLDDSILEELELNIGTLISIYLKPVKLVFRLSKSKNLKQSAAIQTQYNKQIAYTDKTVAKTINLVINAKNNATTDIQIKDTIQEYKAKDSVESLGIKLKRTMTFGRKKQ